MVVELLSEGCIGYTLYLSNNTFSEWAYWTCWTNMRNFF